MLNRHGLGGAWHSRMKFGGSGRRPSGSTAHVLPGAILMWWDMPNWIRWTGFNLRRLPEPIGNLPPAELEQAYYRHLQESAMAA
jgi:hypothetical protein